MFILVEDFNRPGLSRVPIDRSLTRSQTGTPRHPVRPLTANMTSFLCGLRAMEPQRSTGILIVLAGSRVSSYVLKISENAVFYRRGNTCRKCRPGRGPQAGAWRVF